jgi:hypothetical protein
VKTYGPKIGTLRRYPKMTAPELARKIIDMRMEEAKSWKAIGHELGYTHFHCLRIVRRFGQSKSIA